MVSQLTYVATVMDFLDNIVQEIQGQIDDYVLGIKPGGRKWMNHQTLYSHSSEGVMGMINLVNFISALKSSWMRRYVIDKLDDHTGQIWWITTWVSKWRIGTGYLIMELNNSAP